jgi:hypothetical protein
LITPYHYSSSEPWVEPAGDTFDSVIEMFGFGMAYSPWSDTLVLPQLRAVQTLGMDNDGLLGDLNPPLILNIENNDVMRDFSISLDGRWAAAVALINPKLHVTAIDRQGFCTLFDELSFTHAEVNRAGFITV